MLNKKARDSAPQAMISAPSIRRRVVKTQSNFAQQPMPVAYSGEQLDSRARREFSV
jgi:hypothetical protein